MKRGSMGMQMIDVTLKKEDLFYSKKTRKLTLKAYCIFTYILVNNKLVDFLRVIFQIKSLIPNHFLVNISKIHITMICKIQFNMPMQNFKTGSLLQRLSVCGGQK